MYYNERFVVSGGIFEYYKYDRLICTTKEGNSSGRKKGENVGKFRGDVIQKAKKEVRRLVNANVNRWTDNEENRIMSKFLTLTFAENVTDIKWANREFAKFVQRLNYYLDPAGNYKIKYLTVVEFQKRGAVHYHTMIFNMPYVPVKELHGLWMHGFVKVNKIDDVSNVGAYVCKYMTKCQNDERLAGQKMYFKSTGLLQPEIVTNPQIVQLYKEQFDEDKKTFETEFEAPFIGKIQYAQYNMNKVTKKEVTRH